ncbi:hypothetical protein EAI_06951 [Harpegnathos saltator]|uniref:C2H2-type domain-containing protein n=1 Tax=Harpegnathos saltator TaxID=610380 RepID=E2BCI9_HARSA|nr:hypothetical protein EAI_06951 [Harpegnathos saltator]
MIAEAKAKCVNHPKPKLPRKKTRTKAKSSSSSSTSSRVKTPNKRDPLNHFISKTEQNEALQSITDNADKSSDLHVMNEKPENAFVVVTTEKRNDGFIAISEFKHSNIRFIVEGKQDDNIHVLHVDQNHRGSLNVIATPECSDATQSVMSVEEPASGVLDEAIGRDDMTAMHLIQTSPSGQNTLNIISKQNESLPVLAIPNPESHSDYSSQIVQVSDLPIVIHETQLNDEKSHVNQDEQNRLMQDEASQTDIQLEEYQSDDVGDFGCEICGEEFDEKDALKEHIKIHI